MPVRPGKSLRVGRLTACLTRTSSIAWPRRCRLCRGCGCPCSRPNLSCPACMPRRSMPFVATVTKSLAGSAGVPAQDTMHHMATQAPAVYEMLPPLQPPRPHPPPFSLVAPPVPYPQQVGPSLVCHCGSSFKCRALLDSAGPCRPSMGVQHAHALAWSAFATAWLPHVPCILLTAHISARSWQRSASAPVTGMTM